MINGMLDFGDDDGLQGFVGGGVGVARVDVEASVNSVGPGFLDNSDTGFAWQAIAGVRAPLSDHWDVGVKYRFFNADNVDLIDTRRSQRRRPFPFALAAGHAGLQLRWRRADAGAGDRAPAAAAAPAAPAAADRAGGVQQGSVHRVLRLG